jgi:hypothetical protein
MLTLPATFDRVLSKLEAGQLEVLIAEDGVNGTSRRGSSVRGRRVASSRQSSGVASVLIVCVVAFGAGVALTLNQVLIPGYVCLGIGGLAALRVLVRR